MSLFASFSGMGGTLAGAYIGNMILPGAGGVIGAAIGGAIGGIAGKTLFPDKYDLNSPPPPKPRENRVQLSTYGAPIPVTYGSVKLAGNIIYMSDITETVNRSRHRQDGVRYYTYEKTYTCTFAVAFCEGPVPGIARIWVNGEVFADYRDPTDYPSGSSSLAVGNLATTVARSEVYFSVYWGTEGQAADPTLSALMTAAETPSYKGICYIVFIDFPVGEFNGVPRIEVEIGQIPAIWVERRPIDDADYQWGFACINSSGSEMIVARVADYLYLSSDYGVTWSAVGSQLNWSHGSISDSGKYVLAGSYTRIYLSSNYGATFAEVQPAGAANKLWWGTAVSGDGSVMAAVVGGGRVYLSTNYGSSWSEVRPNGDANYNWVRCRVSRDGNTIVAAQEYNAIYISYDQGANWSDISLAGGPYYDMDCNGDCSVIAISVDGGHVYISTDYGASWSERKPSGATTRSWRGIACNSSGNRIAASNPVQNIYLSDDYGVTWTEIEPSAGATLGSIAMNDSGDSLLTCSNRSFTGRVWTYLG